MDFVTTAGAKGQEFKREKKFEKRVVLLFFILDTY